MSNGTMMHCPVDETLPNGALILFFFQGPNRSGIVLGYKEGTAQPYATWEFYRGSLKTTSTGHYFDNIIDAEKDFHERLAHQRENY